MKKKSIFLVEKKVRVGFALWIFVVYELSRILSF